MNINDLQQFTEFQELILRIAADNDRKYLLLATPVDGSPQEEYEQSDKHLREAESLVDTGWLFVSDPVESLSAEVELLKSKGSTVKIYLVTDKARKLFKTTSTKPN